MKPNLGLYDFFAVNIFGYATPFVGSPKDENVFGVRDHDSAIFILRFFELGKELVYDP